MPRSRKKVYEKKPFESTGVSSDTSANIYMSMILSDAWRNLNAQQQRLYLYCKAQYYAEKKKPQDDPLCFTMPQSKWCALYGLYSRGNGAYFRRDMGALIEKGFITCESCGANNRTKSIYKFSDEWKRFGTDAFSISDANMTDSMRRKKGAKKM